MDKEGNIDLERISSSVETISSIESLVNLVDLSDNFEDIEKNFRQVNFEHSNCLSYKESMNLIYEDLGDIKRKINELADALRKTKANYTNINSFSDKEIKQFSQIFKATPASEDLQKLVGGEAVRVGSRFNIQNLAAAMPTPNTSNYNQTQQPAQSDMNAYNYDQYNQYNNGNNVTTIPAPVTEEQPTEQPIDTVPIGIAIGATGIAGAIGAVIVDDMYGGKKKKVKKSDIYFDDYNEDEIIDDEPTYESRRREIQAGVAQGPYRAARLQREADRFYGSQLQDMSFGRKKYEDDDDDNIDYDDF